MTGRLVSPDQVRPRPIQTRDTPAGRRWQVKWRIESSDRTRAFKSKQAAVAFHAELVAATTGRGREMFDADTSLPASWNPEPRAEDYTFLDVAITTVERLWDHWGSKNRMGRVESLAQLVVYATTAEHPDRQMLRRLVRNHVLTGPGAAKPLVPMRLPRKREYSVADLERALRWLERHSQRIVDLDDVAALEKLLEDASRSVVDGHTLGRSSCDRARGSASLAFDEAVRMKVFQANPVRALPRRGRTKSMEVEPALLPTPEEAAALVDGLSTISASAVRLYRAFFTVMWSCGTRPSELYGLRAGPHIVLPNEPGAWGSMVVSEPLVGSSGRWTDDGQSRESRPGLKSRNDGSIRRILLPPAAVRELRAHLDLTQPAPGELIFRNNNGNPLDQSVVGRIWRTCRTRACEGRFTLTVYQLRHTAASTMLRAGVPVPRAAQQLGNSVPVFLRTYARIMSDDDTQFMRQMDAALGSAGSGKSDDVMPTVETPAA